MYEIMLKDGGSREVHDHGFEFKDRIANAQQKIEKAKKELTDANISKHKGRMREIVDKITEAHHFIAHLEQEAADVKINLPKKAQGTIDETKRKLEKVEAMIAAQKPICEGVRRIVDASKLRQTEGQR